MINIVVFIPCYNCKDQAKRVITGVNKILNNPIGRSISEVWVVDNLSPDGTYATIQNFIQDENISDKVKAFQNSVNMGLGGSFKKWFITAKDAGYSHFVVLHGDDQADTSDLVEMLSSSTKDNTPDAVLGARFMKTSKLQNYSKIRTAANVLLNILLSLLSGHKIYDLGSGLNIYRVSSFSKEFLEKLPSHIAFDLHVLFYLIDNSLYFKFLPISWKSADERSTINQWQIGFLLLSEILKWKLKWLCRWPASARDS